VVEGSVRRSGNRVRVSAQLVDGLSGNQIWAERYDRELEDVFVLQDELALTICGAIEPELAKSEQRRVRSKAPENMDAWDFCHRGMWLLQTLKKGEVAEARRMFERSMSLDPNFSRGYVGYVGAYSHDKRLGFLEMERDDALQAARRAVELDGEDAWSHWALGLVYYVDPDPEAAIPEFRHAIQLNPSFADAHSLLGSSLLNAGRAKEAIPLLEQAIRLSPREPFIGITLSRVGLAHLCLRRHEDAVAWLKNGVRHQNTGWPAYAYLISALGHLGLFDETRRWQDEMLRRQPEVTVDFARQHTTVASSEYMDHMIDGLRKAGLPE
jgi:tetratricopeptide (TPR) repeat protein